MRSVFTLALLGASLAASGCGGEGPAATSEGAGVAASPVRGAERGRALLEVEQMVGVPRPYAGPEAAANAIRGVPGGGLPWVIGKGEAKLLESGLLRVEVKGLVFDPEDATVIERGLANRNTVPGFRAVLSCRTVDAAGAAALASVQTAVFPATQGLASEGGGSAEIEEVIAVPRPCIAPIVFVTSPAGAWFAASGF